MTQLRLLLADDHKMLRQGIAQIIAGEPDMVVVAQADNGAEALRLARQHRPDIALLDINMPAMDGVAVARELSESHPEIGVIILTMYRRDDYVFEAIKAGAKGYLLKEAELAELLAAIRAVARGEAVIDGAMARLVLRELRGDGPAETSKPDLNERDLDILRGLTEGLTNQDIAARLDLAEKTVRNRVSALCRRLQLKNRTQAALYALREGLVETEEEEEN